MINETIAQIEARLIAKFQSTPPFNTINLSPSATAMWLNYLHTVATEIFTLQQLNNTFETEIEATIEKAIPATALWIQAESLKFQYDATTPQVAQINSDFTIGYPIFDATKQIITACAVVSNLSGIINIKVVKAGNTPLSGPELTAFSTYADLFLPAGAIKNIISVVTDLLRVNATIYYNGQYQTTIQASVEAALNAYMATLPFNGTVKVSDVERAILSVAGVTDVVFTQITATPVSGSPINLVLASTELARTYQTYSGSIENDPGNPFSATLTYVVANT